MKTNTLRLSSVLVSVLALSACTTLPTGPAMLVLPGTGKNMDQFRSDEGDCRQYASAQIGSNSSNQTANYDGSSVNNLQMRYDFAYQQCMYAKGHRIPVMGRMDYSQQPVKISKDISSTGPNSSSSSADEDDFVPPPPPGGNPPPPPPDI